MGYKKFIILMLVLIILPLGSNIGAQQQEVIHITQGSSLVDINGDGLKEIVEVDSGRSIVKINSTIIDAHSSIVGIYLVDLTLDNNKELIIVEKGGLNASLLSYSIYKLNFSSENLDDVLLLYQSQPINRGSIDVKPGKIAEKYPIYSNIDSNCGPRGILVREYSFDGSKINVEIESYQPYHSYSLNDTIQPHRLNILDTEYHLNPPRGEIEKLLEQVAMDYGIPPVILKAIAYTESGLRQFHNGKPLALIIEPYEESYGIMQVNVRAHIDKDTRKPIYDPDKLKSDIEYNIRAGAEVLLEKWGYAFSATTVIPKIGDNNPRTLENWYFTIWAYNGWSYVNNPNDNSNKKIAYQDKVIDYALSQFNQTISKVNRDDLPETGVPDKTKIFSTPQPSTEVDFIIYSRKDVVVDISDKGMNIRDANGRIIGKSRFNDALIINEGPELQNGYIRYRVDRIPRPGEDQQLSGYVVMNWIRGAKSCDLDKNGVVDIYDILESERAIGLDSSLEDNQSYDINNDGIIDQYDLSIVKTSFILNLDGDKMPDGGKSVIFGDQGYYIPYGKLSGLLADKLESYRKQNNPVYVKLADGIFIDHNGNRVEVGVIPKVNYKYYHDIEVVYQLRDGTRDY